LCVHGSLVGEGGGGCSLLLRSSGVKDLSVNQLSSSELCVEECKVILKNAKSLTNSADCSNNFNVSLYLNRYSFNIKNKYQAAQKLINLASTLIAAWS